MTTPGDDPSTGRPSRFRWPWLLLLGAGALLWFVWEDTPTEQTVHLELGQDHGLNALSLACRGSGNTEAGVTYHFPKEGAPRQVVHRGTYSGPELICEVRLHRGARERTVTRRVQLHGNSVVLPLQHEIKKLGAP